MSESGNPCGATGQGAAINVAQNLSGAQIGLYNHSSHSAGLQLGFFNAVTEGKVLQIGFLNFRDGTWWPWPFIRW